MRLWNLLKGKAKETVGSASGSDELRREGQAQQREATEKAKADRARRAAETHEARAERHRKAQERRQGT